MVTIHNHGLIHTHGHHDHDHDQGIDQGHDPGHDPDHDHDHEAETIVVVDLEAKDVGDHVVIDTGVDVIHVIIEIKFQMII